MGLKEKRPLTPGQRGQVMLDYSELTKKEPEKSLTRSLKTKAGRGATGRVTVRHRGGGNRRLYRMIDFKRDKDNIPAKVMSIEYDPNRNAWIALLEFQDGEKRYILAPLGIKVGDEVASGEEVEIVTGNALPLRNIPVGTTIHNVELTKGKGGQLARGAGAAVSLMTKEGDYATLKLPSGEFRKVHLDGRATIGQVGNLDSKNVMLGKAGKSRHLGRRPQVRGVAMNPCDHPHGGGEGRSPIGMPGPVSPWGQPTLGYKTRKRKKPSSRFIILRRK